MERHLKAGHKTQDQLLLLLQAKQKVEDVALLDGPAFVGALGGWGIGGQPDLDQGSIVASICLPILHGDLAHPVLARLLHLQMNTSQQVLYVQGPPLLKLLVSKDEFAQIMGHAQRMETCIAQIHAQGVMHRNSLIAWQDVHGLQGVVSSFGMGQIAGEEGGASHMQPPALAQHPKASFISMQDAAGLQSGFDLLDDRSHPRELFWQAESTLACEKVVSKRSESNWLTRATGNNWKTVK